MHARHRRDTKHAARMRDTLKKFLHRARAWLRWFDDPPAALRSLACYSYSVLKSTALHVIRPTARASLGLDETCMELPDRSPGTASRSAPLLAVLYWVLVLATLDASCRLT